MNSIYGKGSYRVNLFKGYCINFAELKETIESDSYKAKPIAKGKCI